MTSASSPSSSPSLNSSSRATSRNYSYVIDQEFRWKWEFRIPTRDPPKHFQKVLSLEGEWNQFRSIIVKITGITPVNDERLPWESFQHVIDPSTPENGHTLHKNEHAFSKVLFDALRNALCDFVEDPASSSSRRPGEHWILLKNSHIGFRRGICRTDLGFKEDNEEKPMYGRSDHGCFVLGSKTSHRKKRTAADVAGDDDMEEDKVTPSSYEDDLTAIVVIKRDTKSCQMFEEYTRPYWGKVDPPDVEKRRSLLGQVLLYALDVWKCLARRGQNVESIPLVFLAGRTVDSSSSEEEKEDTMNHICCFDGHMEIPAYCGDDFSCFIDQMVPFSESFHVFEMEEKVEGRTKEHVAAASTGMAANLKNSRDEQAIAIYIKTMRIGLEHAFSISKNRNESNTLSPPVSLCCRELLQTCHSAQLIASPIPNANGFGEVGLKIYQGEMFALDSPTKDSFGHRSNFNWFVDCNSDDVMAKNCLVKVSSKTVHRTYVSHDACRSALREFHNPYKEDLALKQALAKVVLGYSYLWGSTLVFVMKDLRSDNYTTLDHQRIREQGGLSELWSAFCELVTSLLLPMARKGVVHVDIRSTAKFTYNILVSEIAKGDDHNGFELRLIDFDSVIETDSICRASLLYQKDAVHWDYLRYTKMGEGVDWESAYRFLFWQVLWIAYTWYPCSASAAKDTLSSTVTDESKCFLFYLFTDNKYVDFKRWLGQGTVELLKAMNYEEITEATIGNALEVLGEVFWGKQNNLDVTAHRKIP